MRFLDRGTHLALTRMSTIGELVNLFESRGFRLEDTRYIVRGELILAFRKIS